MGFTTTRVLSCSQENINHLLLFAISGTVQQRNNHIFMHSLLVKIISTVCRTRENYRCSMSYQGKLSVQYVGPGKIIGAVCRTRENYWCSMSYQWKLLVQHVVPGKIVGKANDTPVNYEWSVNVLLLVSHFSVKHCHYYCFWDLNLLTLVWSLVKIKS